MSVNTSLVGVSQVATKFNSYQLLMKGVEQRTLTAPEHLTHGHEIRQVFFQTSGAVHAYATTILNS